MSKGEPDQELKKAFMELQGKMQETNQKLRIADVQVESLKKQIVHAQLTDKEIQEALPADEQETISVAEWEAECAAENERLHSAEQETISADEWEDLNSADKMPPKTKIFIGKLPPTCKDFELIKLFERYGEVTECTVLRNYAFVHMKTEDQAGAAIRNLNNWDLNGFKISVEQSKSGEKRAGSMGGGRGGMGGFRGRGGSMRGRGMGRPGPYNRRPPMADRLGPSPPGPTPAPPMRNGYYDDYERRDRRPLPPPGNGLDRRPPMLREPAYRDPYDRYDSYDRMPPPPMGRRTPPPMNRSPPPMGHDRRDNPYGDMYGSRAERDTWGRRDMFSPRGRSPPRRSPPRRYSGPLRDMSPRRF